jgi:hypothetical protein
MLGISPSNSLSVNPLPRRPQKDDSERTAHKVPSRSMRSSTAFFSCYQEPLLPGNIRLLRLYPDKAFATPIRCELFHYSLEHAGDSAHPYDALSYVWGDQSNPKSIFVENRESTSFQDLSVTRNLYSALLRLRHRFIERIIWVDAVCISQNDDREKEQQIQLMAKIYGHSTRVIVWLGESENNSDLGLRELQIAGRKSKNSMANEETQQAIWALLQRPWFRRIWVYE